MRKNSSFNHFVMLATAAVAMLMASCTHDEVVLIPDPIDDSRNIGFSANVVDDEAATRGGASRRTLSDGVIANADGDLSLPLVVTQEQGIRTSAPAADTRGAKVTKDDVFRMRVWATYHKDGATELGFNDENHDGSQGLDFVRQEGSSVFHSDPQYMWPGSGTFDFVSVGNLPGDISSSISEANPGSGAFYATLNSAGTAPEKFTYRVPDAAERQSDIIIAKATGIQGDTNASVPLDFKHIMAAVNFKVGDVVAGTIKSISLTGVYNKGEYLLAENQWVNRYIEDGGVFNANIGGDRVVGTDGVLNGTQLNSDGATFMMIPQSLFSGAELVVEFVHANGKTYTLRASISGNNWAMGTTTNYMINIDHNYELQIVPQDNKLDSHFIITKVDVYSEFDRWQLTAQANDGADVTIQFEEDVNPMAKQGYWTDKYAEKQVNSNGEITYTIPTNAEYARGVLGYPNGMSGSTGIKTTRTVYVFIPENISTDDRIITLTLKGINPSKPTEIGQKQVELIQHPVKWFKQGSNNELAIGLETLIEHGQIDWGFCWDGVEQRFYCNKGGMDPGDLNDPNDDKPGNIPDGQRPKMEAAMRAAGIDVDALLDPNNFVQLAEDKKGNDRAYWFIRIDYSQIGNIEIAEYPDDGYQNTWDMYHWNGISALSSILDFIAGWDEQIANTGDAAKISNTLDYAAMYAMKRNRFNLYVEAVDGEANSIYVPVIDSYKDLNWYLPAKDQFVSLFTLDWGQHFSFNDYFWTSTAILTNTGETAKSYAYVNKNLVEANRTDRYLTMAVRRYTVSDDIEIGAGNSIQNGQEGDENEKPTTPGDNGGNIGGGTQQ